jgi:hypothetical protein
MAKIFISHSSANNAEALALRDWLVARGWDDLFLDIDPHRGLVSGQRWLDSLQANAQRCKAVLFVLSRAWLASRYCTAEFWEARKQERPLFALVVDDIAIEEVAAEMRGVWQLAFLTRGSRFETFSVLPPPEYAVREVLFSHEGLESLRIGLSEAGLTSFGTESFPWPARGFEKEADGTTPRRPYRGLKPIDGPDAGVFFGRDADLVRARDLLADLRERGGRFLVPILGASGSGKSSFLRAGLIPRLARDDRRFLLMPIVRPRGAAMWGDEGLLAALEEAHRRAGLQVRRSALRVDLESGGAAFLRRLADLRSAATRGQPEDTKPPTLILPIDQAEELFTRVRGDEREEAGLEENAFLLRIAELLRHGPEAGILATIRSDSYGLLQTATALEGLPQIPLNLPPLDSGDYRSVIDGPADRVTGAGRPLTLEPGLAATLLAEAQGVDALPLLSFTLERLYVERGGEGELARSDFEMLGGVQGSIESAVAEAFEAPDIVPRIPSGATEREALLKRAFVPYLMGVNETNGEPVRRTAHLTDLPFEARGLIDRLVDHRLLVSDQRDLKSGSEGPVIEVAHEALRRRWPILRRWHDDERSALLTHQEVERASAAWNQCGKGADWLAHRGARLTEAEAVASREDFVQVFAGTPSAYLSACRQAEDSTRNAETIRLRRQRALQRRLGTLLAVVAIVTLIGGGLVLRGKRDLDRRKLEKISRMAKEAFEEGQFDRALRLALVASQGTWLTSSSVDATIQLGRAAQFTRLEASFVTGGRFLPGCFLPDGKQILTASGAGAQIWSRSGNEPWRGIFLQAPLISTAFCSPNGQRIVTGSRDGSVRVWNRTPQGSWNSSLLQGHHGWLSVAIFFPNGRNILTASDDETVRIWRQDISGAWRATLLPSERGESGFVYSAAISANGKRILTASSKRVHLWSLDSEGKWMDQVLLKSADYAQAVALSPDGSHAVAGLLSGKVSIWTIDKAGAWRGSYLVGHRKWISSVAFSIDGAS